MARGGGSAEMVHRALEELREDTCRASRQHALELDCLIAQFAAHFESLEGAFESQVDQNKGGPEMRDTLVTDGRGSVKGTTSMGHFDEAAAPLAPLPEAKPTSTCSFGRGDATKETAPAASPATKPPSRAPSAWMVVPEGEPALQLTGMLPMQRHSFSMELHTKSASLSSAVQSMLNPLVQILRWGETTREPERTGPLAAFVRSRCFNVVCVVCIALNSYCIAKTADYEMKHLQPPPKEMANAELAFTVFYALELFLKLLVHRFYFYWNSEMGWNIFDTLLVVFSSVEVTAMRVASSGGGSGGGPNLSFLRMLRICKTAKVLRVIRAVTFFRELRLMLDCVLGSFMNLFWCVLLMFLVLLVFALLLVQGLTDELEDPHTQVSQLEVSTYFASVSRTIVVLLQCTTNGMEWQEVHDVLSKCGGYIPAVFVFFILFFYIAAWNIITSMFVDKALRLARPDLETLAREQKLKDINDAEELMAIFTGIDSDNSRGISLEEFSELAQQGKLCSYLRLRGIDIKNAGVFFEMLRTLSGADEVDLETLVATLIRMRGFATSIDLHSLSFETKLLSRRQHKFMADNSRSLQRIEDFLRQALSSSQPGARGHGAPPAWAAGAADAAAGGGGGGNASVTFLRSSEAPDVLLSGGATPAVMSCLPREARDEGLWP